MLFVLLTTSLAMAAVPAPAFPGAEGFGANTPGGRNGSMLVVTTTDDYDPRTEQPIAGSPNPIASA